MQQSNRGRKRIYPQRLRTSIEVPLEIMEAIDALREKRSRTAYIDEVLSRDSEIRRFLVDQKLSQIARDEIAQCRDEGLAGDDLKWMAVGAVIREGRNQGVIGEELDPAMNAAIQALVNQELK